jgi:hypothetical protein
VEDTASISTIFLVNVEIRVLFLIYTHTHTHTPILLGKDTQKTTIECF